MAVPGPAAVGSEGAEGLCSVVTEAEETNVEGEQEGREALGPDQQLGEVGGDSERSARLWGEQSS